MRFDRNTLGPHLRRERERRGITLDSISGKTKIARAHLARLERGDVADWPSGIFRRAFFRDYVTAIGLDAEALLPEFLRVFPDPKGEDVASAAQAEAAGSALRLTLDAPSTGERVSPSRLIAAAIDALAVITSAGVVALTFGHGAAAAAIISVVYQAITTAGGVQTFGMWLASREPVLSRVSAAKPPVYVRSSRPSRAMMRMATIAATNAAKTAADSHQTHGSFAHQAPVIR